MTVSPAKMLILAAVIVFALAAFSVSLGSVALVPAGLALFAASFLV